MAHITAQDSVRKNGSAWESARAEESASPPKLTKEFPGDGRARRM